MTSPRAIDAEADDEFILGMPKVELHIHLVGALPRQLIGSLLLAEGSPNVELQDWLDRTAFDYGDARQFGNAYIAVNNLLLTREDFTRAVLGVAYDLCRHNVVYAEIAITPMNHLRCGVSASDLLTGLEDGRLAALDETGVQIQWCFAASGRGTVADGHRAVDLAVEAGPSVVSFGLGGPEVARRPFAELFRRAKGLGLHIAPHAGETGGPDEVWAALLDLGAERVGHGIRSIEDSRLMDYLAEHRIPIEVCPTSNVATRAVPSLEAHPVGRFIENSLTVTINSDDPTLFGTDISTEYRKVRDAFGLKRPDIVALSRNAMESSFLSADSKAHLVELLASYEDRQS